MEEELRFPSYRWVILGLAWSLLVTNSWARMVFPPLANAIMTDLNITLSQYILILTGPMLIGIVSPIPGGVIGDHFGFRISLAFATLMSGTCYVATSFAPNYLLLITLILIGGFSLGAIFPSLAKLVSVWFPRKEIGIATGIYMTGFSVGMSIGLATTVPLFGTDWRKAVFILGIVMLLLVVVWLILTNNKPVRTECLKRQEVSIKVGLTLVAKSRNVWLLGIMMFLVLGPMQTITSLLPKGLNDVYGITPSTAGLVTSLFTLGRVIGDMTLLKLSDKVGLRRPFFFICAPCCAICAYLSWHLALSSASWVLLAISGVLFSGAATLTLAIPLELSEVGNYAATANSFAITMSHVGAFVIPTFIIAPIIESFGFSTAFGVGMAFLASAGLFAIPLKETGWRVKYK